MVVVLLYDIRTLRGGQQRGMRLRSIFVQRFLLPVLCIGAGSGGGGGGGPRPASGGQVEVSRPSGPDQASGILPPLLPVRGGGPPPKRNPKEPVEEPERGEQPPTSRQKPKPRLRRESWVHVDPDGGWEVVTRTSSRHHDDALLKRAVVLDDGGASASVEQLIPPGPPGGWTTSSSSLALGNVAPSSTTTTESEDMKILRDIDRRNPPAKPTGDARRDTDREEQLQKSLLRDNAPTMIGVGLDPEHNPEHRIASKLLFISAMFFATAQIPQVYRNAKYPQVMFEISWGAQFLVLFSSGAGSREKGFFF